MHFAVTKFSKAIRVPMQCDGIIAFLAKMKFSIDHLHFLVPGMLYHPGVQESAAEPPMPTGGAPPPIPGRQAAFDVPDEVGPETVYVTKTTKPGPGVRIREDFRESWIWTEISTGYRVYIVV